MNLRYILTVDINNVFGTEDFSLCVCFAFLQSGSEEKLTTNLVIM